METACESKDPEQAHELLLYFIQEGNRECFAAMLYTCYDLLKPDVVMETAWRHGLSDVAMPFMIQVMTEYVGKVDMLEGMVKARGEKEEEKEKQGMGFVAPFLYLSSHVDMNMMASGGLGQGLMITQGGLGAPSPNGMQNGF